MEQIKRSSHTAASSGLGVVLSIIGGFVTFVGAVGGGSSFDGKHEILADISGMMWVIIALVGLGIMYVGVTLATKR